MKLHEILGVNEGDRIMLHEYLEEALVGNFFLFEVNEEKHETTDDLYDKTMDLLRGATSYQVQEESELIQTIKKLKNIFDRGWITRDSYGAVHWHEKAPDEISGTWQSTGAVLQLMPDYELPTDRAFDLTQDYAEDGWSKPMRIVGHRIQEVAV